MSRKLLALFLAFCIAALGARAAVAMGSMAMQPPASPAQAAPKAAAPAAVMDHCAQKPDDCCDFDLCAFFCATVTIADLAERFTLALRMEPVSHPRPAVQAYPGLSSSPPAPPPRLLS